MFGLEVLSMMGLATAANGAANKGGTAANIAQGGQFQSILSGLGIASGQAGTIVLQNAPTGAVSGQSVTVEDTGTKAGFNLVSIGNKEAAANVISNILAGMQATSGLSFSGDTKALQNQIAQIAGVEAATMNAAGQPILLGQEGNGERTILVGMIMQNGQTLADSPALLTQAIFNSGQAHNKGAQQLVEGDQATLIFMPVNLSQFTEAQQKAAKLSLANGLTENKGAEMSKGLPFMAMTMDGEAGEGQASLFQNLGTIIGFAPNDMSAQQATASAQTAVQMGKGIKPLSISNGNGNPAIVAVSVADMKATGDHPLMQGLPSISQVITQNAQAGQPQAGTDGGIPQNGIQNGQSAMATSSVEAPVADGDMDNTGLMGATQVAGSNKSPQNGMAGNNSVAAAKSKSNGKGNKTASAGIGASTATAQQASNAQQAGNNAGMQTVANKLTATEDKPHDENGQSLQAFEKLLEKNTLRHGNERMGLGTQHTANGLKAAGGFDAAGSGFGTSQAPQSNGVTPQMATASVVEAATGSQNASFHDVSVANQNGRAMGAHLASQVGLKIGHAVKAGTREFSIRMDPPELGKMDIKLSIDKAGKLKTIIHVENKETLAMLQKDSGVLERTLQDAGLKTDNNSLSFNLKQEGQSGEQAKWQERQGRAFGDDGFDDDLEDVVLSDEEITEAVLASMNLEQGLDIKI